MLVLPCFFLSACLCCQNPLNGAIPVPGPTKMMGRATSSGRWKLGALKTGGLS